MQTPENPICVALDTPSLQRALELTELLQGSVGMVKVGMEFFYAHGHDGYNRIADLGIPVFLDLKLHDIPNTVAAGLSSLMELPVKPAIVNVHASGGPEMMKAAREAVSGKARLIAVTILTSLDDDDLAAAGFDHHKTSRDHVVNLAGLTQSAGLDGIVCSPLDLTDVRTACGRDFLTVVPGIRPQGTGAQDQKRISTPCEARDNGADILVIGRAITGAGDPERAALEILDTL